MLHFEVDQECVYTVEEAGGGLFCPAGLATSIRLTYDKPDLRSTDN